MNGRPRAWGVYRELAHSPGRETDDALILRAAAELLTPAQRVEKIAELQAKVSGDDERKTVTVVGNVVREDGGPLPAGTKVMGIGVSPNRIQAFDVKVQADGAFSIKRVQASRVLATASAEGFAPAFAEAAVDEKGEVGPLKLVLARGFEARVRLVDEAGKPVAMESTRASVARATRTPRARSAWARLSAGKRWPPVPPAQSRMVGVKTVTASLPPHWRARCRGASG